MAGSSLSCVRTLALTCCVFYACAEDQVLGPPNQGLEPPVEGGIVEPEDDASSGPLDGGDLDRPPEGPCDLTGRWMVHRIGFSTPETVLADAPQKASTWHYFEVRQDGDDVLIEKGLWCNTMVTGTATVAVTDLAANTVRERNRLDGRRGTYAKQGDGCELDLERIYMLMSVGPYPRYLAGLEGPPGVLPGDPESIDLEPLPEIGEDGVEDWDEDGEPGIAYLITESPLGSGVRHAVQRNWDHMVGPTPLNATDFNVPADWGFDEVIHKASSPFLMTGAVVRQGSPHQARWVRTDVSIVGADDAATCKNVAKALPHRPVPEEDY